MSMLGFIKFSGSSGLLTTLRPYINCFLLLLNILKALYKLFPAVYRLSVDSQKQLSPMFSWGLKVTLTSIIITMLECIAQFRLHFRFIIFLAVKCDFLQISTMLANKGPSAPFLPPLVFSVLAFNPQWVEKPENRLKCWWYRANCFPGSFWVPAQPQAWDFGCCKVRGKGTGAIGGVSGGSRLLEVWLLGKGE